MRVLTMTALFILSASPSAGAEFDRAWSLCEKTQPDTVLDCVSAELAKTRPPLPVAHPLKDQELRQIYEQRCAEFVHPDTGRPAPGWCVKREIHHRTVFLRWYQTRRDPAVLGELRGCLTSTGGVSLPSGLIDDANVNWPAAVDCADGAGQPAAKSP